MKCPKCKRNTLRKQVSVFVDVDADAHSLDKKAIRKKDVVIQGVGWDRATIYCQKCGYMVRLESKVEE